MNSIYRDKTPLGTEFCFLITNPRTFALGKSPIKTEVPFAFEPTKAQRTASNVRVHFTFNKDCNLKCKYCFVDRRVPEHYDVTKAKKVIDAAFEKYGKRISSALVSITGEPLIDKKSFWEIYNYVKEKNPNCTVFFVTNGYYLNKEDVDAAVKQGFFVLSLDGPKAIHMAHRPAKSDEDYFDKLINNIKTFTDNGVCMSIVSTLMGDDDIPIWDILDYVYYDLKCKDHITFTPIRALKDYWTDERSEKFLDRYEDFYAELFDRVANKRQYFWLGYISHDIAQVLDGYSYNRCVYDAKTLITIDSEGNVFNCEYNLENSVGNIFTNFDAQAYDNTCDKNMEKLEKELDSTCNNCQLKYLCGTKLVHCKYMDNYVNCEMMKIKFKWELRILAHLKSIGLSEQAIKYIITPTSGKTGYFGNYNFYYLDTDNKKVFYKDLDDESFDYLKKTRFKYNLAHPIQPELLECVDHIVNTIGDSALVKDIFNKYGGDNWDRLSDAEKYDFAKVTESLFISAAQPFLLSKNIKIQSSKDRNPKWSSKEDAEFGDIYLLDMIDRPIARIDLKNRILKYDDYTGTIGYNSLNSFGKIQEEGIPHYYVTISASWTRALVIGAGDLYRYYTYKTDKNDIGQPVSEIKYLNDALYCESPWIKEFRKHD